MSARSLGAASIIIIASLTAALALDARALKQAAISDLDSHRTGVAKLDAGIDDAIKHIRSSLALPDGTSLFTGQDTIAPAPTGGTVFDEEQSALSSLAPIDADSRAPQATKDAIARVSSDLVAADRAIAVKAIDTAATYAGNGSQAQTRLDQARRDLASGDGRGTKYKQAISDYESAWLNAERSILEANPSPVVSGLTPAPGSYVTTSRPLLGATIETVLDLLQLDPKSIVLLLDGVAVVDGGAGLRTSAITIDAFGGRATISLQAPSAIAEGSHTLTLRARATQRSGPNLGVGNVGPASVEKSWTFFTDTRSPIVQIDPANGTTIETETPTIKITFSDPTPGSGVAPQTLAVFVDGTDRTSRFTVSGGTATWTIPDAEFLAQGPHLIAARIADAAGNVGSATSQVEVDTRPAALSISIAPSSPDHVEAGSLNDVTVRWVTPHGATSRHATGFVRLTCTDHRSPLDNMVLEYSSADLGTKTITQLAAFLTAGVQTVVATSIPSDGSTPLTGSLTVNVVAGPAIALVFTSGGNDERLLPSETPSPFSVAIEDAFQNRRSDVGTNVTASIALVGSTTPLVLTSAIDATTTASFVVPRLDVGSYDVTVSVPAFPAVPARTFRIDVVLPPTGDIFVRLPRTPVPAGQTFDASVFLNVGPDDGDPAHVLGGYDICLSFDPDRLSVEAVEPVAQTGPYFLTNLQKPGFVAVSALNTVADGSATNAPVSGLAELFKVRYRVLASARSGLTPVGAEVWDVVASSLVSPAVHLGAPTPRAATGGVVTVASQNGPSFTFAPIGISPLADTAGIASGTTFSVVFSDAVAPVTLPGSIELIRGVDGASLPVQVSLGTAGRQVIVRPVDPLEPSRRYVLVAHTTLRSQAGASLVSELEAAWFTGQIGTNEDWEEDGRQSCADALVAMGALPPNGVIILPPSAANSDAKVPGGSGFSAVLSLSEPQRVGAPPPPAGTPPRVLPRVFRPGRGLVFDNHSPYPRRNKSLTAEILGSDGTTKVTFDEATNRLGWVGARALVPPIFAGTGPVLQFPDGNATVTVIDDQASDLAYIDSGVPAVTAFQIIAAPTLVPPYSNGTFTWSYTVTDDLGPRFGKTGLSRVQLVYTSTPLNDNTAFIVSGTFVGVPTAFHDYPKDATTGIGTTMADTRTFTTGPPFVTFAEGRYAFRLNVTDQAGHVGGAPPPPPPPDQTPAGGRNYWPLIVDSTAPDVRENLNGFMTDVSSPFPPDEPVAMARSRISYNTMFARDYLSPVVNSGVYRLEVQGRVVDQRQTAFVTRSVIDLRNGAFDSFAPNFPIDYPGPGSPQLPDGSAVPPDEGLWEVRGAGIDRAENQGTTIIRRVIFDRHAPTGTVKGPVGSAPNASGLFLITNQASGSSPAATIAAIWTDVPAALGVTPSGVGNVVVTRTGRSNPTPATVYTDNRSILHTIDGGTFPDSPSDDTWTYFIDVTDRAQNRPATPIPGATVVYDRTPPVVTFVTTKKYLKASDSIVVQVNDRTPVDVTVQPLGTPDPNSIYPSINVTTTPSNDFSLQGSSSATVTFALDPLTLTDGTIGLIVTATDTGGRVTAVTQTFTLDRAPPSITITAPTPAARTTSNSVLVSGTWFDATSAVDAPNATFTLVRRTDGARFALAPRPTTTSSGFSGTAVIPDGDWDIVIEAPDLAGNVAQATTRVTVDTLPPVVQLQLALGVQGPRPIIQGTVSDAVTGLAVSTFHLYLDAQDVTDTTVLTSGSTRNVFTFRFDSAVPLVDGSHLVRAVVQDGLANVGSASRGILIDATPPTRPGSPVGAPRPVDGAVVIRWLASADLGSNASGLGHYLVERSDDDFHSIASSITTTDTQALMPPVLPGSRYRIRAVDRVGNESDAVDVHACEAFCIERLDVPAATTLHVAVVDHTGADITDARVFVEQTGDELAHVSGSVYERPGFSTTTSTSLSLRVEAPTTLGIVVVRSGSLLALQDFTDFGVVVVRIPGIEASVISAGGVAPFDSSTSPGDFYAGATIGEPAVGRLGDTSSPMRANAGFWQVTDTPDPYVYVTVLLMPPVVCCPNVPIYYAIFSEDTSQGYPVQIEFSADEGATWTPAKPTSSGGEPTTGLLAAPGGVRHVFLWDAGTDLANVTAARVQVRLFVPAPFGDPTQKATGDFIYRLLPPPALTIKGGALQGGGSYSITLAPGFAKALLTLTGVGATFGDGSTAMSLPDGGSFTLNGRGAGLDVLQVWIDGVLIAVLQVGSTPPDVVALSVPATISGASSITYSLRHATSAPADVIVEYDPSGTGAFRRATQAGSASGSGFDGVQGVATSPDPAGRQHVFLWDTATDLFGLDLTTVRVRVSARGASGVSGLSQLQSNIVLKNSPSFETLARPTTGNAPRAVTVADVNGDGRPDLLVADREDGTLSVLLGNGDGRFQPRTIYKVGTAPSAIAVGDLNRDGRLDVVVANEGSHDVSVLLGTPTGFADPVRVPVGNGPRSIVLAKTGHAFLDLVVADSLGNTITIFPGNGNGAFGDPQAYYGGQNPGAIAVADFDGDGVPDVAVASDVTGEVSILRGDRASGGLQPRVVVGTAKQPVAIAAGDLDLDGRRDLVVASPASDSVSVFRGNGDGTFAPPVEYLAGKQPASIAIADLDADGMPDLVATDAAGNFVYLRGSVLGIFGTPRFYPSGSGAPLAGLAVADLNHDGSLDFVGGAPSGSSVSVTLIHRVDRRGPSLDAAIAVGSGYAPRAVAVGDVNGDGKPDLVAACDQGPGLAVLLGNGDATFQLARASTSGVPRPTSVALGDVNGDGKLDVAVADQIASVVAISRGNGDGTFAAPVTQGVGAAPVQVRFADVNGDGRLDVVTANMIGGTVSVLLGNGDGTYRPAIDYPTGGRPLALAIGDVNKDGLPDIVASCYGDSGATVSILLGRNDWTFAPPIVIASGGVGPGGIALGDLDKDGSLDVVVADSSGQSITVLRGHGDGSFDAPRAFAVGENPFDVTLADVDGDGFLDAAVANYATNDVTVLVGDGAGGFRTGRGLRVGANPLAIVAADLNGDGIVDLAAPCAGSDQVTVVRGNGDSTFRSGTEWATGETPLGLTVGDLNGDALPDLVTTNHGGEDLSLRLATSSGNYGPETRVPGALNPAHALTADLNGDGRLDVLTLDWADDTVSIYLGRGDGTFSARAIYPSGGSHPRRGVLADVDQDGKLDLVVVNQVSGTVALLLGNGDGTFQPAKTVFTQTGSQPVDVVVADFDRDGRPDLLVALQGPAAVLCLRGLGSATFALAWELWAGGTPDQIEVADVDGDGNLDVVATASEANGVTLLMGRGDGSVRATVRVPTVPAPCAVAVVDVNRDGKLDLVVASRSSDLIAIHHGLGGGAFEPPSDAYRAGREPRTLFVGDVDQDGWADIVAADYMGNAITVLPRQRATHFERPARTTTSARIDAVALADLDGDGKRDLVTVGTSRAVVTVRRGNGDGTFGPPTDFATAAGPTAVLIADLDGDGRRDLVVACRDANVVSVLRGNGDGTFQPRVDYVVGTSPSALVVADLDRDGVLDLAVANAGSNDVSILRGAGGGAFAPAVRVSINGRGPVSIAAADLNGDGVLDLVTADAGSSSISQLEGRGDGSFFERAELSTGGGSQPSAIAVADVTGDGRADLVCANAGTNDFSVLAGQGNGTFSFVERIPTGGTTPTALAITDLDLDGRPEIVIANSASADVSVLTRLATGYRREVLAGAGVDPTSLAVADLNGDGRGDTVVGGAGGTIAVFVQSVTLPLAPSRLQVTGFPSPITAGVPGTVTVVARDGLGNVVPSYQGTVHLTSDDAQATLSADLVFTLADGGAKTATVTLRTAGTHTIVARDTQTSSLAGQQSGILVQPAAAASLMAAGFPRAVVAGTPSSIVVTALDAFGNRATGYGGTVHVTSTDAASILPPDHAFTPADAGAFAFPLTLTTSGLWDVTASDTAGGIGAGSQQGITVVEPTLTVSSVSPLRDAENVPATASVTLSFSADVDPASVASSSVYLRDRLTTNAIAATTQVTGAAVTVAPVATFTPGVWVEVVVTPDVRSANGAKFNQDPFQLEPVSFRSAFKVEGKDPFPPSLVSSSPASGSSVASVSSIVLVFDRPLLPSSATADAFTIMAGASIAKVVSLSSDARTVTLFPVPGVPSGCATLSIASSLASAEGVALGRTLSISFEVARAPQPPLEAPTITSPADQAVVSTGTPVVTGSALPSGEVRVARLIIDGIPTPVIGPIDPATGAFSLTTIELAQGDYRLQVAQERVDGSSSPPSLQVVIKVRVFTPPPFSPPGAVKVHEILAGRMDNWPAGMVPIDRVTMSFNAPELAGQPFRAKVHPKQYTIGANQRPRVVFGGQTLDVTADGIYGANGIAFVDSAGVANVELQASDMVGEKYSVAIVDSAGIAHGDLHEIHEKKEEAVIVPVRSPDCCSQQQVHICLRAVLQLQPDQPAGIYPVPNRSVKVSALDTETREIVANVEMTDLSTGSTTLGSIVAKTTIAGNAAVTVCSPDKPVTVKTDDPDSKDFDVPDVFDVLGEDPPPIVPPSNVGVSLGGGAPLKGGLTGFIIFAYANHPPATFTFQGSSGPLGSVLWVQKNRINEPFLVTPEESVKPYYQQQVTTSAVWPARGFWSPPVDGIYLIDGVLVADANRGVVSGKVFGLHLFARGKDLAQANPGDVTRLGAPFPRFQMFLQRKVALKTTDYIGLSGQGQESIWSEYWNGVGASFTGTAITGDPAIVDAPLGEDTIFSFPSDTPDFLESDVPAPDNNKSEGPKDAKSLQKSSCDPVTFNNGQLYLERVDLAVPGRGVASFSMARTYKSEVLYDGPLGFGWSHEYDQRIERHDDGSIAWLTGTGKVELFTRNANGTYQGTPGVFERLLVERGADGTDHFVVRAPNGCRHVFRDLDATIAPGKLDSIVDTDGNRLRFEYGTSIGIELNRLVRAIDPYDRVFTFKYNAQGRIETLRDETLGREVKYRYSGGGDLIKVTSPADTTTTTGEPLLLAEQQFPGGTSEIYHYTCDFASEKCNHKLIFIVAPNEAEKVTDDKLLDHDFLRPLSQIENEWNTDASSPFFGRIMCQRWGGTNETGLDSGGVVRIDYKNLIAPTSTPTPNVGFLPTGQTPKLHHQDLNAVWPTAGVNDEVQVATVTDRNGNLTEFFHNKNGNCVRERVHANRNVRPRGTGPGQDPEVWETIEQFDQDGLKTLTRLPLGGEIAYTYDKSNPDPAARANLIAQEQTPDARGDSRGGLRHHKKTFKFEPVYNQLRSVTDERWWDTDYLPQNGGPKTAERYTTTHYFDYEQTATLSQLARETGLDETTLQARLDAAGVVLGRGDLNEDRSDDAFISGHVVKTVAPAVRRPDGTSQDVVTLEAHNRYGQIVRMVDAEHNVQTYAYHPSYDPDGDGQPTAGTSQTDITGGYLAEVVIDSAADPRRDSGRNPPPARLTRRMYYDPVGNMTRTIDPRGVESRTWYDMHDQPVRAMRASAVYTYDVQDPGREPLRYESLTIYDRNGRPIEVRVSNQGERDGSAATVSLNPWWTTKLRYDLLGDVVTTIQEIEPIGDDAFDENTPGVAVTQRRYDADQNPTLVILPEGNAVSTVYDERNKPFRVIRGWGTDKVSVTTRHYDLNGNLQYFVSALKKNPAKNTWADGDVTTFTYDGFDRQTCAEDPEGDCGDTVFDPLGRSVRHVAYGPDDAGPAPRMAETQTFYDEQGRPFRSDTYVFTDTSPKPFARTIPTLDAPNAYGEELATSTIEYDALGRGLRSVDTKGADSFMEYDGAGRVTRAIGPEVQDRKRTSKVRNEVLTVYDGNSNAVRRVAIDRSPILALPDGTPVRDETFVTDDVYDAVNRLVRTTDAVGQTTRFFYDSRNDMIATTDAKGPMIQDPLGLMASRTGLGPAGGQINDHGNVTRRYFDGLSRLVKTESLQKTGGVGDGDPNLTTETNLDKSNPAIPTGIVTTQVVYDRNSRVKERIDPNGARTIHAYDALDRCEAVTFADGTVQVNVYDADDDVTKTVDPNGSVIERKYDGASRLVKVQVTKQGRDLGGLVNHNVLGTTLQAFEYDGLSRTTKAIDDNGDAQNKGVGTLFTYDSISRKLTERHVVNAQVAANDVGTTTGRVSITGTGRSVDRTVTSDYTAPSPGQVMVTRTGVQYSSGRKLAFAIDGLDRTQSIQENGAEIAGYEFLGTRAILRETPVVTTTRLYEDGDQRLTKLSHATRNEIVAAFGYAYDRADQRTHEQDLRRTTKTTYGYDSLGRVTEVAYGVPASGGTPARMASYLLDGAHNFVRSVEGDVARTTNLRDVGTYAPDALNRTVKLDTYLSGVLTRTDAPKHDAAGARIQDASRSLSFDAFDRLVQVDRSWDQGASYRSVGAYTYDALGRRVSKTAHVYDETGTHLRDESLVFVLDGADEIEEVDAGSQQVVADNVFGAIYVDEPVQIRRGATTLYLQQNAINSIVSAVDAATGEVAERYDYTTIYGVHQVTDAGGTAKSLRTELGNPWRFQGRRLDAESGLLFFRARYLDPEEGRFVNRDPRGVWGDGAQNGNAYAFCAGDPVNGADPDGLGLWCDLMKKLGTDKIWRDLEQPLQSAWESSPLNWAMEKMGAVFTGEVGSGWRETKAELNELKDQFGKSWDEFKADPVIGTLKLGQKAADWVVDQIPGVNGLFKLGRLDLEAPVGAPGDIDSWIAAQQARDKKIMNVIEPAVMAGLDIYGAVAGARGSAGLQRARELEQQGRIGEALLDTEGRMAARTGRTLFGELAPGRFTGISACFLAGTLVVTSEGLKPIEKLKRGDRVLSAWSEDGAPVFKPVLDVLRGHCERVCRVTVAVVGERPREKGAACGAGAEEKSGAEAEDEPPAASREQKILCTPRHPFYRVNRHEWVGAEDLEVGDRLRGPRGERLEVRAVEVWAEEAPTFNLEVGDFHTYFVAAREGAPAVWVHNKGEKKTYVTYTKVNPETGQVYSGRSSGPSTMSPEEIVAKRDTSHHMTAEGFGPAKLDKASADPHAIRGREEMLIEHHGGAQSAGGTSGNPIRGISEKNPNREKYLEAANREFGPVKGTICK